MLKRHMLACLLLICSQAFANQNIEVGNFEVGIGSDINLKTNNAKVSGPAVFLGNVIAPDGTNLYQMYLTKADKKVYYIDAKNFSKDISKLQTVLDPIPQAGGTCVGYAMDNFLQQTNLSGFVGNGELAGALSTEEGRTNLLVDAINRYYLVPQHKNSIVGILSAYGKMFDFKCKKLMTDSYEKAKSNLLENLKAGQPVVVSYFIGPEMAKSPFGLKMFDSKDAMDDRLWAPRKIGERNAGGHGVVAAGTFELDGKDYMVMVDSDWSEPRVWDMDAFLNDPKTALSEIEFISCK
jgi:hypothetical protein